MANERIETRGPLSPYLFLIVQDVLSRALSQAVSFNVSEGLKIRMRCPMLSHMFFADDSIIFLKASSKKCLALLSIINTYYKASSQSINFEKLCIFFSKNTEMMVNQTVNAILSIPELE